MPTQTAPKPPTQSPKDQPPAPPAAPLQPRAQPLEPAPPVTAPPPTVTPPPTAPSGQWVYTNQYGWLWMPYDPAYTHVFDEDGLAYNYVFYPSFGWRWVIAPWVLGLGPVPFWGVPGPLRFSWYARPWFHFGGPYRGWRPPHGPFPRPPAIGPGPRHR